MTTQQIWYRRKVRHIVLAVYISSDHEQVLVYTRSPGSGPFCSGRQDNSNPRKHAHIPSAPVVYDIGRWV